MISTKKVIYKICQAISTMKSETILLGEIRPYAGSTAPSEWLVCDGSAVSRTTYADLFAVIGTTYGTGDGSTTFNLPDLGGKVPIGANSSHALGSTGGAETVTLTVDEMPSHTHTQNAHSHGQDAHQHALREQSNSVASGSAHGRPRTDSQTSLGYGYWTSAVQPAIWGATATNNNTGGGQAHNNMQPYTTVNFIIYAGV